MSAVAVVNRYLKTFYSGDFAAARALVAETFQFKGPFVEAPNRDAYFNSAAPLAQVVRGHHLLHQWQDGDDVCSIYDVALRTAVGEGVVTMCEWDKVKGELLQSSRLILDTAAFRALMPAR